MRSRRDRIDASLSTGEGEGRVDPLPEEVRLARAMPVEAVELIDVIATEGGKSHVTNEEGDGSAPSVERAQEEGVSNVF